MTLEDLQARIGHTFKNKDLLKTALDIGGKKHRMLEFEGDGILDAVVRRWAVEHAGPKTSFGQMHDFCSRAVSNLVLALVADNLEIPVLLGDAVKTPTYLPKIYANVMEALFAAVAHDADFNAARRVILKIMPLRQLVGTEVFALPEKITPAKVGGTLAAWCRRFAEGAEPEYHYTRLNRKFWVATAILGDVSATGTGESEAEARRFAAACLLFELEQRRLRDRLFNNK